MDKIKMTKEEFDMLYEIEDAKQLKEDVRYGTDTSEEEIEEVKEESILTEEEEAQDKALEESLGWDTEIE